MYSPTPLSHKFTTLQHTHLKTRPFCDRSTVDALLGMPICATSRASRL
jgi:hypothetical protein